MLIKNFNNGGILCNSEYTQFKEIHMKEIGNTVDALGMGQKRIWPLS